MNNGNKGTARSMNLAVLILLVFLKTAAAGEVVKGPVKVFILGGQSNMEGKALASTLEAVIGDATGRGHHCSGRRRRYAVPSGRAGLPDTRGGRCAAGSRAHNQQW